MSTTRQTVLRRLAVACGAGVLALGVGLPAVSVPDKAATTAEVERAFHEAEAVNEQVNQLDADIAKSRAAIDTLTAEIAAIQAEYDVQRDALGATIVQQQLDSPLGPTVSLLGSEDPEQFLEGVGAVQALNASRADALEEFGVLSAKLSNRRAQLEDRTAGLEADKASADAKRAEVQDKYEAAKAKLERLTAAERTTINTSNTTVDFTVAASGRAGAAIDFALAQLGKPYVYGGTGPDGYDCSGLVQTSYKAAGVSLPRVVGDQYNAGQPVPLSQLQPGDIVAYGDMSHNGIYLGDGRVVHAPRPGRSVEITSMSGFTKAARVG